MGSVKDAAGKEAFTPSSFLFHGAPLATLSASPRHEPGGEMWSTCKEPPVTEQGTAKTVRDHGGDISNSTA